MHVLIFIVVSHLFEQEYRSFIHLHAWTYLSCIWIKMSMTFIHHSTQILLYSEIFQNLILQHLKYTHGSNEISKYSWIVKEKSCLLAYINKKETNKHWNTTRYRGPLFQLSYWTIIPSDLAVQALSCQIIKTELILSI